MPNSRIRKLTSKKVLISNILYSLIGQGIPLIVALFSLPLLIKGLGTDRFGILTLVWMVIGYFSLFDLGLGRALTQIVAEKIGLGEEEKLPSLIWTASLMMIILGVLGAIVVTILSPWLVFNILKVPKYLERETLNTFYLLAASIPIVTSTAGHVGVLSALQRFDLINIIKTPMSIFMFLGPLIVLQWTNNLFPVVLCLVVSRFVAWIMYTSSCIRTIPVITKGIKFEKKLLKELMAFGGWMTVTNVIGPFLVSIDRLLIGSLISVTAVSYYTTPYEVVTKLWIVPAAIVGVLFPAFSMSYANNVEQTIELLFKSKKYIAIVLFPIILAIITFAGFGLENWLGKSFSEKSTLTLQWLAAGVFINSVAQVSYVFIQGIGKPEITAKIHCIQLPFYLLLLWALILKYGILGAALAWFTRIFIDTLMLFYSMHNLLGNKSTIILRNTIFYLGAILGVFFVVSLFKDPKQGIILFSTISILGSFVVWKYVLSAQERKIIMNLTSR
jgi:O-antigen/teichoic acid export membrane protein